MPKLEDIVGRKGSYTESLEYVGTVSVNTEMQHAKIVAEYSQTDDSGQTITKPLVIDYSDRSQYEKPTPKFLDAVIELHERYRSFFEAHRDFLFRNVEPYIEIYREMEVFSRTSGNIQRYATRVGMWLVSAVRTLWTELKSPRAFATKVIDEADNKSEVIELYKGVVQYGVGMMREILYKRQDFPEDIKERYKKLIEVCNDILYLYNNTLIRIEGEGHHMHKFCEAFG